MPALPSFIIEPLWDQFSALIPERRPTHPLGCHRPRIGDRIVFDKLAQIAVLGVAYDRIADTTCSATTIRQRRDEWITVEIFEQLEQICLEAYDQIVGLDLGEVTVDRPSCGPRWRSSDGSIWVSASGCPTRSPSTSTPDTTVGRLVTYWTNSAAAASSARRASRSRPEPAGSWSAPTPGTTVASRSSSSAPNDAPASSTPSSHWPAPPSSSADSSAKPGPPTAGTPDHHDDHDLLAEPLSQARITRGGTPRPVLR